MQKSLHLIDESKRPRWQQEDNSGHLGGIPDIVVRATNRERDTRWAIIDAKLRRRSGPPTEELYKILGYVGNFELEHDPRGAILFHAPGETEANVRTYVTDDDSGLLIATALNPSNHAQVRQGMTAVVDMVLSLLDLPPTQRVASNFDVGDPYIDRLVAEMRMVAAQLSPITLDASRRRVKAILGEDIWDRLDGDCKDMLATGEHVGFTLDNESGDFSGPVLSLVVPLEILLHEHLWVPAIGTQPGNDRARRLTLGQVVSEVLDTLDSGAGKWSPSLRTEIERRNLSEEALRTAMTSLKGINQDFRTRAAHKEKLGWRDWNEVYRRVLARERVLQQLLKALNVRTK